MRDLRLDLPACIPAQAVEIAEPVYLCQADRFGDIDIPDVSVDPIVPQKTMMKMKTPSD